MCASAPSRPDWSSAAFEDLLVRIPADVQALKADGYLVHRPVVFFLSDGQPTDSAEQPWQDPYRKLTDRAATAAAPNVISWGVGTAQAATILEVATRKEFAFVAVPGADVGGAIAEFFQSLTASLVASGRALASDQAELVIEPPAPEQFRLAIDLV
jgi:uncharacterized protein YegL